MQKLVCRNFSFWGFPFCFFVFYYYGIRKQQPYFPIELLLNQMRSVNGEPVSYANLKTQVAQLALYAKQERENGDVKKLEQKVKTSQEYDKEQVGMRKESEWHSEVAAQLEEMKLENEKMKRDYEAMERKNEAMERKNEATERKNQAMENR